VPYFEDFIGPPHTYTVDYDDVDALHVVLQNITRSTVQYTLYYSLSSSSSSSDLSNTVTARSTNRSECQIIQGKNTERVES